MPSSARVDLGALAPAVHEYLDELYSGRGHGQSELAESVLAGLEELLPAAQRTPADLWTYECRASAGLRPDELVEAVFCAYLDLQQHRRVGSER